MKKLQISVVDHSALDRRSLEYIRVIANVYQQTDRFYGLRMAMGWSNQSMLPPEVEVNHVGGGILMLTRVS